MYGEANYGYDTAPTQHERDEQAVKNLITIVTQMPNILPEDQYLEVCGILRQYALTTAKALDDRLQSGYKAWIPTPESGGQCQWITPQDVEARFKQDKIK